MVYEKDQVVSVDSDNKCIEVRTYFYLGELASGE